MYISILKSFVWPTSKSRAISAVQRISSVSLLITQQMPRTPSCLSFILEDSYGSTMTGFLVISPELSLSQRATWSSVFFQTTVSSSLTLADSVMFCSASICLVISACSRINSNGFLVSRLTFQRFISAIVPSTLTHQSRSPLVGAYISYSLSRKESLKGKFQAHRMTLETSLRLKNELLLLSSFSSIFSFNSLSSITSQLIRSDYL